MTATPAAVKPEYQALKFTLHRKLLERINLDALAGITAIAFAGQIGWLTATEDGSLFIWRPALTSRHAPPRP